jgi:glycosyltransferase involved in cell wall biosynthesis
MNRPICSIIIPTRNCLNYLPTTLASIDAQNRCDLEVILVDDGSTDGTANWARARPASGFSLTLLETGGIGPGAARNAGVAAASADLIAFLDADDTWSPGKLDAQLAYHGANPMIGFSFTDYLHVTPDGAQLGTCFAYWGCTWTRVADDAYFVVRDAEARLLGSNLVGTSTVLMNRDAFLAAGGFSARWASAEDWDLWLRVAALAPVACSTYVTMSYLMRPGSETSNRRARLAAMAGIIDRYRSRTEPVFQRTVRLAQARLDVATAEAARADGDPRGAARAHLRALLAHPDWRTGRAFAADAVAAITPGFARHSTRAGPQRDEAV